MRAMCVVLVILGGSAGYWWLRTYEPVTVIQEQLAAIDEGQYPRAYGYLSSTTKTTLSFEQFVALIQNNSVVMEIRETSFPTRVREGESARISGMLMGYGEMTCQASYVLMQEDGQWKIRSFQWAPPHRSHTDHLRIAQQRVGMPAWEKDNQYGTRGSAIEMDSRSLPVTGACCS
ncbi:MAG: DUF4864 domain-containing protein [Nitrospira sp.]|nr:DUF4864 domain-containing protein [Nitrospira sp.]